jgi:hypothetical protein
MRFSEIYDRIIVSWPQEILISDGYPTNDSGGYYFPTLSKALDDVEKKTGSEDHWGAMMVWTMFQVFHQTSQQLVSTDKGSLNTREVKQSEIEQQYYVNLQSDEWADELRAYERI